MTSAEQEQTHPNLQQETSLQPRPRSNRVIVSLVLTALGGFVGGMLTSYGPTYLNVYLTQPVLSHDTGSATAQTEVAEIVTPTTIEAIEAPANPAPKGSEARLVVQSHDRSYLVIRSDVPISWGQGPLERRASKDLFIFTLNQRTKESALPAELLAYQDRHFVLHDAQGYACTATTGPLKLLQQGASDYDDLNEKPDWDAYGGGPLLVAQLTATRGDCKSALWARDAALPPASIARVAKASQALRREARRAFRATAAYKTLQAEFESQGGGGRWDTQETQSVTFASIKSAEQELVLVASQFGGCGDFEAQVGIIFRRNDEGALELIKLEEGLVLNIDAAADIDGDGDLDLMTSGDGYDRSLMRQSDDLIEDTHSAVNIHYCRC